MNAWLLTWEGTDPAITDGRKLIAILSGRRALSFVRDLAKVLYLRNYGAAYDMSYFANRKGETFYACTKTWNGGFTIGKNPWVYARQVSELMVQRDESANTETVSWKEPPSWRQVPERNYVLEQVDPGKQRFLVRSATATVANDLGRMNT
jgi:hypothetical protein